MHLKVVLQGNLGHYGEAYSTPKEFWQLRGLVDAAEVAIADSLAHVGERHWPEIEAILANFWCPGYDLEGETVKHFRRDRVLEASVCINCVTFLAQSNASRCNGLFFRALTLAAAGFREYHRGGAEEIEAIRDTHFRRPGGDCDF